MSGFAAIVRFDGAPADTRMLARMLDAMDYRGPDDRREWTNGQCAIGHLMLHTTGESLAEIQPLANQDGSLVLAMDGWLANRDDLHKDLISRGVVLRADTDAELVLGAYQTWGEDCPQQVDGEYAFILWDSRNRELVCVKDHAGTRPLHYHWDKRRLLVASDLAGVLAADDFEPRPNRGMIAEHLAFEFYSNDETLWDGVMRVPAAHVMRVSAAGPRLKRHWLPPLEATIHYSSDEEYQAHYRDLLVDCVRRASRSHRPLACEVSGGHDSSAIFSLAHQLSVDRRLLAPSLKGYTYNFESDADDYTDDLPYARAVSRFLNVPIEEVRPFMPGLEWFAERGRSDRDLPPYPNTAMRVTIGQTLTTAGSRVCLGGEGGDEFIGSHYPFYYAEHLQDRDFHSLILSLREDIAAFGPHETIKMLYQYGIGPTVPRKLRKLRRILQRLSVPQKGRDLLPKALVGLLDERAKQAAPASGSMIRSPARRSKWMTLENPFLGYVHDYISRNCARLQYEVRSPLYARRMIEFAFALPHRQRRRGDVNKHMHLAALCRDLPAEVLERKTKATFNVPFLRQLDNVRQAMLPDVARDKIDWLDADGWSEMCRKYDSLPTLAKPIYGLWTPFGCWNLFS